MRNISIVNVLLAAAVGLLVLFAYNYAQSYIASQRSKRLLTDDLTSIQILNGDEEILTSQTVQIISRIGEWQHAPYKSHPAFHSVREGIIRFIYKTYSHDFTITIDGKKHLYIFDPEDPKQNDFEIDEKTASEIREAFSL
jgi:hypothetical protein